MRLAIVSDIHGNLAALEAVLADIRRVGADLVCSLGDIVGYGPEPAACVELVRGSAAVSLLGNHDAAVIGRAGLEEFNEFARLAVEWTASRLAAGHLGYLGGLPLLHRAPGLLLAHASPVEPELWHYIHGEADVDEPFARFAEPLCFVGHSHRPGVYALAAGGAVRRDGGRLPPGVRHLVNVGSVGQPRDRDPRASYVVYDEEQARVDVRRVPYPVAETQRGMQAAGLPAFLVDRLAAGV